MHHSAQCSSLPPPLTEFVRLRRAARRAPPHEMEAASECSPPNESPTLAEDDDGVIDPDDDYYAVSFSRIN